MPCSATHAGSSDFSNALAARLFSTTVSKYGTRSPDCGSDPGFLSRILCITCTCAILISSLKYRPIPLFARESYAVIDTLSPFTLYVSESDCDNTSFSCGTSPVNSSCALCRAKSIGGAGSDDSSITSSNSRRTSRTCGVLSRRTNWRPLMSTYLKTTSPDLFFS